MNVASNTPSSFASIPPKRSSQSRESMHSSYVGATEKNWRSLRTSSTEEETIEDNETDRLVQLLALQSYHLPGNNWIQDWFQFMANNHPVFGICCHKRVHPIKSCARIIALIGTITFGLAVTNLFYLFFLWNPEYNREVISHTTESGEDFVLTTGMLLVWTIGGGVHCMFNLAMWHIAACACCQRGGFCESCACCPSLGKYMIRFFVACIFFFCLMVVLLRVAINDHEQYDTILDGNGTMSPGVDIMIDDEIQLSVESASEFMFVTTYLVEMTLSFFVYYPIGGTMLFSGVLACGCHIPVLGGRPYEIECEKRRMSRQQRKDATRRRSSEV